MKIMSMLSVIIIIIVNLLIMVLNWITKKTFTDREKSSPFECGFDPKMSARLPFSLQFFLIAVIFLIFDVEITLLLPFIKTLPMANIVKYSATLTFFIIILILGILHEWNQGALQWAK